MTDTDEIWNRSTEGSPFSNSTMGEIWMARWCDRCLRDAPFRNGLKGATGCQILAVALCGRTPAEWLEQPEDEVIRPDGYDVANLYHCIQFRGPGGGSTEPRPRPEPPNMDGLFPRPQRQTRMYVQPELQPATSDRTPAHPMPEPAQ